MSSNVNDGAVTTKEWRLLGQVRNFEATVVSRTIKTLEFISLLYELDR